MQDQIFTFETLLRRMQLDDGERPFVIWREKDCLAHMPIRSKSMFHVSFYVGMGKWK